MDSDSPGPEGSSRAVPHVLVRGWRSRSGHTGDGVAELKQRNGAGGDPRHRGTQTHSCHRPHGGKRESLPDSVTPTWKSCEQGRFFFQRLRHDFFCQLFIFKLLNFMLPFCGQCSGTAAEQEKGLVCWPWCAGVRRSCAPQAPLRSRTHVVFPVVKPSGAQHPRAWRRSSPWGQGADLGIMAIGRMLRTSNLLNIKS